MSRFRIIDGEACQLAFTSNLAALGTEVSELAVMMRMDGGTLAGGIGANLPAIYSIQNVDGSVNKAYSFFEGDGAGNIRAAFRTNAGGDYAYSGWVPISAFDAGVDFLLLTQFIAAGVGGIYQQCHLMELDGTLIGTPIDVTDPLAAAVNGGATGYMVINNSFSYYATHNMDGVVIYAGTGAWRSGAARYATPIVGQANQISYTPFSNMSGATASNAVSSAPAMTITGVENTHYEWLLGGQWNGDSPIVPSQLPQRNRHHSGRYL